MLRVALYIRVSTDEQALHGDSIETQKTELKKYALNNNYSIVDYYIDEGYTATTLKRPGLIRLLDDIKSSKIDMVLFTKIDRWSRGVRNYYKIQDILDKNKTDWKTIFESYDTSTAAGRLHINIMLSVAENESAQTSERIKAVFKTKIDRGEILSGKVPKGYKIENKKLVIDPETAPMVIDIFNYYEYTRSLSKLVDYVRLNYYHIHQLTLRNLLRNPLYKGEHRNSSSTSKLYCEPLVSEKQWSNVQRQLEINSKCYSNNKYGESIYIFSGLLKCKECGHIMGGNRYLKENKKIGKYIYKTYKCQYHFKEKLCSNGYSIPEQGILERFLIKNLKSDLEKYIADSEATVSKKQVSNSTKLLSSLEKKLLKLKDLYLEDMIDKEIYRKDYTKLVSQIDQIKASETTKNSSDLSELKRLLTLDIESIYAKLSDLDKRNFWSNIIDFIEIGNSKNDIVIHFI